MRRLICLLVCVAAGLVVVASATATRPTTGTRINLLTGAPATFPAGAPFYVDHGHACELSDRSCISLNISGRENFLLYIDGILQPSTIDMDVADGWIFRLHLSNYATGLPAGTHTFVGVWTLSGYTDFTRTATIVFS